MTLAQIRLLLAGTLVMTGLALVTASAFARESAGELRRDLAVASASATDGSLRRDLAVARATSGASEGGASGREGGQQPGGNPNFTGVVTAMDAKDVTAGRRKFEAGARTAWHSHDKGQLIYAESGRMRTGQRGQPIKEYDEGGSEYTPPNVEHWHGATPAGPLVQVNIQFGGTTRWLVKTTDDEYAAKK